MKLFLVDDHALFLQSLKVLLVASGYEVVGTASDGLEAFEQVVRLQPDLILMDIEMPVCDGLSATRLIKAEMPQVKIVMLTVSSSDEYLFEAIKSGASGYLLKSQSAELFLELISKVESGAVLSPEMAAKVLGEFARQAHRLEQVTDEPAYELTDRQTQILTLVAQGMPYTKIGDLLHISEPTVRYHMGQILERLHLQNRAQVIAYTSRHGMIR